MLRLHPSEQGGWEIQRQSLALTGASDRAIDLLTKTSTRDGMGLGFGICAVMFLAAIAWFIRDLTIKLDPANVALQVTKHIQKTEQLLTDIDRTTEGTDGKVDTLLKAIEDIKLLQERSRNMGLEMSGQLHEIQHKVTEALKAEIGKK